MGRQFEFNRDETLTKAMEVFWQKGYKATSMKDLIEEMGIQPGSIYNTFGDKHSLFIKSIKHYGQVVTSNALKILNAPGSPSENIKKFFYEMVNRPAGKKSMGCLIVNTVVELAPHDKEAAEVVNGVLKSIENAFFKCLKKAQDLGEVSSDANISALASYYSSSTHGLLVTCKSEAPKKQMQDIVEVILSTLPKVEFRSSR